MDTEAACIINDPPIRSSIATTIAISKDMAIIQHMTNRILFNKAEPMGDYLLVPFTCSDIGTMELHRPSYDRTDAENQMATAIGGRIAMALVRAGYEMVNLSFTSMKVKVKPIPPVKY